MVESVCTKLANGATWGPGAVMLTGCVEVGVVMSVKPYVQQISPGVQKRLPEMAAPTVTPPLGGESIVNAAWVIPRAFASNVSKTWLPSLLVSGNQRTIWAHPPAATVPDKQSLPGAGCVS